MRSSNNGPLATIASYVYNHWYNLAKAQDIKYFLFSKRKKGKSSPTLSIIRNSILSNIKAVHTANLLSIITFLY